MARIPTAPPDLSPASADAWPGLAADLHAIHGGHEADFTLLANVLRAEDRLAGVAKAIGLDGVTVTGSKGQLRPHPLLAVETVLRREVAEGLDRLRLSPAKRDAYWKVGRSGRLTVE